MSGDSVSRRTFLQYSGSAAAGAAAVSVAGCTDDEGNGSDEFEVTITQGTFPTTLDPTAHNDTPTNNVLNQAYDTFLYRDRDKRLIANIVTDWERVSDNTVSLEVRDDVTFHSGNEMTAEDVAFSINRANNPEVSEQAGVIGAVTEANAADGSVEVELEIVEPAIFRNLSAFGRVVEQSWIEEREQGEVAEDINGTGAYQLTNFVDDSVVEYERFDDYWGDQPAPTAATFDAVDDEGTRVDRLTAGESDIIVNVNPRDIPEIRDTDGITSQGVPSNRNIFLVMNDAKEPFDDPDFRRAMNYAVDVQSIIDSILNEFGNLTSQPTLEGMTGYAEDVDPYPYDPEEAQRLVESSEYDDVEITLNTTTGRYLRDTDIAETAAGQIDELSGVSCDAELRDTSSLFAETLDGDQETSPAFFLLGWGNPTFDANYTLGPFFTDTIFQHFQDDELAQLINDANALPDNEERRELLREANRLAHDLAPWVFLHQQFSIYGHQEDIDWEPREDEDVNLTEVSQA